MDTFKEINTFPSQNTEVLFHIFDPIKVSRVNLVMLSLYGCAKCVRQHRIVKIYEYMMGNLRVKTVKKKYIPLFYHIHTLSLIREYIM